MATTPVYALRYQVLADAPNGATLGQNLATDVENQLVRIDAVDAAQNANRVTDAANIAANTAALAVVTPLTTAWTDWTVVWTASVTNPTLGNGSITGRYKLTGKKCEFWWCINIGTTTNAGSGAYTFSFPTGVTVKGVGTSTISGGFRDASGAAQTMGFATPTDGAAVHDLRFVQGNQAQSTQPYVWASGDFLRGWGWIEIP